MRQVVDSKKKAKGTLRDSRKKHLPVVAFSDDLAAPDELSELAKKEWQEIAPILHEHKLLTRNDRKALMTYCNEMAKYWRFTKELDDDDVVLQMFDKTGTVVIGHQTNPLCSLADKALDRATAIGLQFGLTPLSRGKINLPDKSKEDTPEAKAENKFDQLRKKGKSVIMKAS